MSKNHLETLKSLSEQPVIKTEKNRQALDAKLAELQTVYQQNELTILGLYRQLENARKQVEDTERQIQNANAHQQGVQREIDDLKKMLAPSKQPVGVPG